MISFRIDPRLGVSPVCQSYLILDGDIDSVYISLSALRSVQTFIKLLVVLIVPIAVIS